MTGMMALALAGFVAATVFTAAQVVRIDGFRGTIVNIKDEAGKTLTVDLIRWSTDAERDKVTAAVSKGDAALLDVLKGMPTLGYVWTGESVGYQIRYAFKMPLPDGAERVILATDRPLGAYLITPWQPAPPATATSYPFTVIEMRIAKSGTGEAKMSITAKVAADATAKTIALDDYATAPVVLKNVRRS